MKMEIVLLCSVKGRVQPKNVPSWNVPSGMKKAPTVMPTRIRNLKNQNLLTKYLMIKSSQF